MTSRPEVSEVFWVGPDDSLRKVSPDALLEAFEAGSLPADTPVRILRDAPAVPLFRYVRELVWMDHNRHVDRKQADSDQSRFRVAWESAPIGMVISDLTGRIQESNTNFARMLGYTRDELRGMRVGEISDSAGRDEEVALGNQLISGARDRFQIEKRFVCRDGTVIDTLLTVAVMRGPLGTPQEVIAQVLDTTTIQRLRHQLLRAEQLNALGKLARGIAHDFNNLLSVIVGLTEPGFGVATEEEMGSVHAAGLSASRLTQQLLAFGNQASQELVPLDINQHVDQLQSILRASLPPDVRLESRLNANPALILGHKAQLEQVLLNLVFNARNAMPRGGELHVQTGNHVLDTGPEIVLEVSDTGVGMTPEVLNRACDPFFTTRGDSGGTGLGLSTVSAIVDRFNGEVQIASRVGKGTTVRVSLPSLHEAA